MKDREETHKEACLRIWSRMASEHPEFTHEHDSLDNPWSVETLILDNEQHFKPFSGANVLDIGANAGLLTAYWALNGAKVTAYEADPITYKILTDMLTQTGLKVSAINAAIWTYTGEIKFQGGGHKSERGHFCRNGLIQTSGISDATMVPCVSLTDALGDTIWDFVKMDIEGAEHEVIMSTGPEVLKNHIKQMQVEFHAEWPTSNSLYWDVRNKLRSLGLTE
jgi:FkbM family methyltransferase